jgi:hypothetical protein
MPLPERKEIVPKYQSKYEVCLEGKITVQDE